eukprot:712011-Pelagomonas_calceolata.AAC.1
MQVMLNRLRAYAMRKGLTVNTSKLEVMHFNRSCSSLPTFMYGDVALPEKEQSRYLGMLVDKHMNLKVTRCLRSMQCGLTWLPSKGLR